MSTHRFVFDLTGHIRPRRFSRDATALVGRQTLQRKAQIRQALPERLRTELDPQLSVLEADVPLLERSNLRTPQNPHDPIPASEAVRDLIDAPVVLTNPVMMNHVIDRHVTATEDCLQGHAVGRATDPSVQAARTLLASLFPEGRAFLRRSNIHQWHHIHTVFNSMSEADLALADRAGVRGKIDDVRALNAHFGLMLGIDLDNLDELLDNPENDDDPNNDPPRVQARILGALMDIFKLATFLWPAPDQGEERAVLIGPFLEEVERSAQSRS